ncbi:transposase, partial [Dysosmobacter sp. HCP28S3_G4]|uniref:transposase n=1 Tax=Dysosmobacter sp. HCP28S3_G4 TaxID=3438938 RepID=UPI003F88A4E8
MKMYRHEDYDQLKVEMPFGVTLREDNRWVILSKKFPWKEIDREYQEHFKSSEGQVAIPSRLAFGALYIQAEEGYTDEQTRRNIQENPYLQYFCGFECYTMDSPFDASMMTHFRKRISPEMIQRINDLVFAPEAVASMDNPEEDDSVNQEDSEDTLSAQPTVEKMIDLLYPSARDLYPEKPRTYRQQARERYLAYTKKRTHTVRETRMVLRGNLQYIQRDIGYIEKMVAHGVSLSLLGD